MFEMNFISGNEDCNEIVSSPIIIEMEIKTSKPDQSKIDHLHGSSKSAHIDLCDQTLLFKNPSAGQTSGSGD